MSLPRQIIPGDTWFISRRCTQRLSLLKPTTVVTAVFMYLLAYYAKQYGIMIHAVCVMSTHYHMVLTDVHGVLPKFMENLNMFLAKVLNFHWGRWENFWTPGSYDAKRCVSVNDALDRMAYLEANPSAAHLAASPDEWPRLITKPEDLAKRVIKDRRPDFFFRPDGPMPKVVSLLIEPLPCASPEAGPRDKQVEVLTEKLGARLAAAHKKYGGRFPGAPKVLARHHMDQPRKPEPRRQISMGIAAHSASHPAVQTLIQVSVAVAEWSREARFQGDGSSIGGDRQPFGKEPTPHNDFGETARRVEDACHDGHRSDLWCQQVPQGMHEDESEGENAEQGEASGEQL
jgi:REP-associated tyrosine transposase